MNVGGQAVLEGVMMRGPSTWALAVRKPDGFAEAMLKLSTYRKLEPGNLEEALFYDHPSGRRRIAAAMRSSLSCARRSKPTR